jgi:transposase
MTLKREEILELCAKDPDAIVTIIQRQEEIIERQNQTIADLNERIIQLEARIAELESRLNQNSRNSNRPPSTDGFRRPKSQRKKGERPPGGQKGHKGRTLQWVEVPDLIEIHQVTTCEGCGESLENLEPITTEQRQVHDIPPMKIVVTEHRVEHKVCPRCGQYNRAEFPPDARHPVQYGWNLKALMIYLSIYQLLPYERICETFLDLFGRLISKATLVKAVSDCHENLGDTEEKIRDLLAGAHVLNVDETGMRVNGIRQWLHVASTEVLTWYGHHRKRGSRATDDLQILPRFKGTMVHDFWASYFRYPCGHALCNVHLLRELKGISENYHQNWSEQMYDLMYEIKKAVEAVCEHGWALDPQQVTDFEERYRQIIEAGMRENPVQETATIILKRGRKKQSKAKNLLDRCLKYEGEILLFMHDFSVPFSNNQAERDIRMMKLQQKISGTFRSEEGADCFCRIRGYISTVKKNEMPVFASLLKVLEGEPFIPSAAHKTG